MNGKNSVDDFIKALAPKGESVRIQMGASGRVVYGKMASGEERCELDENRLVALVDALREPVPPVIEQNYSNKRPAIEIQVDGNTVFRQERDGVVSVNDVLQFQIEGRKETEFVTALDTPEYTSLARAELEIAPITEGHLQSEQKAAAVLDAAPTSGWEPNKPPVLEVTPPAEPEPISFTQPEVGLAAELTAQTAIQVEREPDFLLNSVDPGSTSQAEVASDGKTEQLDLAFLTERSRLLLGLKEEVSLTPEQALAHLERDAAFWEASALPESDRLISERLKIADSFRAAGVEPDNGYRQNLEQQERERDALARQEAYRNLQESEQKYPVGGALAVAARLAEALPVSNTKQLVADWVKQTTAGVAEKGWALQSSFKKAANKAVEKGLQLQSSLLSVRSSSGKFLEKVNSRLELIKSTLREQQVADVASKLFNYHQQQILAKSSGKDSQDYTTYKGQNYTLRLQGRNTYEIYENGKDDKPLMRFKQTAWGFTMLKNQFTQKHYRDFAETKKKMERFGMGELAPGVGRKHLGQLAPVSHTRGRENSQQSSIALE